MTVTSKWVALHEVSDYLAKGWREVHIIGGCDDASLMVSPEEPASEPAKVECPNCGNAVSSLFEHYDNGIPLGCNFPKPAQPEPVAAPTSEMPEAVRRRYTANDIRLWMMARGYLTTEQHNEFGRHLPTSNMGHCMADLADALDEIESLRTHAAQPAPAVAMTREYRMVEDAAAARGFWHLDKGQRQQFNEIADAIAAVRDQAAEAGKVRLPKVRSYFLSLSMLPEYRNDEGRAFLAEVKAELDAAEGRK